MCAYEVDGPQRGVGFVMGAENDCAGLFAGEADDEVAQGDGADGRVGSEGVFFELIVGKVRAQVDFSLGVTLAGGPAPADGHELPRAFHSLGALEGVSWG